MKQLQLQPEVRLWVYDLVGALDNQEVLDLLAKLGEIGHRDLMLDLESAINAYAANAIEQSFAVGFQCRENPALLIFKGEL